MCSTQGIVADLWGYYMLITQISYCREMMQNFWDGLLGQAGADVPRPGLEDLHPFARQQMHAAHGHGRGSRDIQSKIMNLLNRIGCLSFE